MVRFILNEIEIVTNQPAGMVLLDFIRYHQHLMGTKIGCREGDCGACTVLVGEIVNDALLYKSMTSCLVPLGNAHGKHIVTIEGINNEKTLNPIQEAMADEGATQCGFCTPGFVVSLAGFCLGNKEATIENAIGAVDGNICRCTGYKSIERAAAKVAMMLQEKNIRQNQDGEDSSVYLVRKKILPEYFSKIKPRLQNHLNNGFNENKSLHPTLIVGGGTDLYVQKYDELGNASIRFVFDNPDMKGIRKEGNQCIIGASATVSDLKSSTIINDAFPNFQRYSRLVSSTPIRNMATIAGNLVNASPIGDFTIFFLALDAQLILCDGKVKSMAPLRNFYKGYKTLNKKPEEYIEQILFQLPGKNTFFNFEKVSKRTHLDIASVNTAIYIKIESGIIESAGISAGGVGPVPMYLEKTSDFLKGKKVMEETIFGAIKIMKTEITPISDARGTKEYKTLLLGQLMKAHFMELLK